MSFSRILHFYPIWTRLLDHPNGTQTLIIFKREPKILFLWVGGAGIWAQSLFVSFKFSFSLLTSQVFYQTQIFWRDMLCCGNQPHHNLEKFSWSFSVDPQSSVYCQSRDYANWTLSVLGILESKRFEVLGKCLVGRIMLAKLIFSWLIRQWVNISLALS